jgi:cell division protein FtsI/penicillin-binding protein 2
VKPRLVLSKQRAGQDPEKPAQEQAERILKPETAVMMRQMMEGVVLEGTGRKAVLAGYTSAGKTGSAQIYDPVSHTYTHTYNASFLGFAPVGNPRVVIAVTLHGTGGGSAGFGGARAARAAHAGCTQGFAGSRIADEVAEESGERSLCCRRKRRLRDHGRCQSGCSRNLPRFCVRR